MPVSDEIRRKKREALDGLVQFPENLGAHSMLLIFKNYEYKTPGTFDLNRVTENTYTDRTIRRFQSILLPLPQNIEDTYNVNVRGFEQGATTGAMAEGIQGISNMFNGGTSSINIQSAFDKDNIARSAAFLARRSIEGVAPNAGRVLDQYLGSTINPKASLFFEGVTQKVHSFSWNLAPMNERESNLIRDITNIIKRNSLPSYGSLGLDRLLLNYPNMLDIFFLGVDQSYFIYYKTCMVQTFTTNYTPNGLAFVKGGKPAMVTMNMNVIEADIHTAEDYGGESGTISLGVPPGDPTQRGGAQ